MAEKRIIDFAPDTHPVAALDDEEHLVGAKREHKFFLLGFVVFVLSLYAYTGAFNLYVNPYDAYEAIDVKFLDPYKKRWSRVANAELLLKQPYEGIATGTSRAHTGVDPEFPQFGGKSMFNATFPGQSTEELLRIVQLASEENGTKNFYVFLDFFMFSAYAGPKDDFLHSRYNWTEWEPLRYHFGNLFKLRGANQSYNVLYDHWIARAYNFNEQNSQDFWAVGDYRRVFNEAIDGYVGSDHLYGNYHHGDAFYDHIRQVLKIVEEADGQIVLMIAPLHAEHLEGIWLSRIWEKNEEFKRRLTDIVEEHNQEHPNSEPVEVWDFATYNPYSMEPVPEDGEVGDMRYWYDSNHASKLVYEYALSLVTGIEPHDGTDVDPSLGMNLTWGSIDAHLEAQRERADAWRDANPEAARAVLGVYRDARARRELLRPDRV